MFLLFVASNCLMKPWETCGDTAEVFIGFSGAAEPASVPVTQGVCVCI